MIKQSGLCGAGEEDKQLQRAWPRGQKGKPITGIAMTVTVAVTSNSSSLDESAEGILTSCRCNNSLFFKLCCLSGPDVGLQVAIPLRIDPRGRVCMDLSFIENGSKGYHHLPLPGIQRSTCASFINLKVDHERKL